MEDNPSVSIQMPVSDNVGIHSLSYVNCAGVSAESPAFVRVIAEMSADNQIGSQDASVSVLGGVGGEVGPGVGGGGHGEHGENISASDNGEAFHIKTVSRLTKSIPQIAFVNPLRGLCEEAASRDEHDRLASSLLPLKAI